MILTQQIRFVRLAPGRCERIARRLWRRLTVGDRRVPADLFDVEHGTETEKIEKVWKLDSVSDAYVHSSGYEGTHAGEFRELFRCLWINPSQLAFVDVGCGKGKTLILAHEIGFRAVQGIDLSPQLVATARKNLGRTRTPGMVYAVDATAWVPPFRVPWLLYMSNPFDATVMEKFLANLAAVDNVPDWFVYYHAQCFPQVEASGLFSFATEFPYARVYRRR